jgi:hypothetical protein
MTTVIPIINSLYFATFYIKALITYPASPSTGYYFLMENTVSVTVIAV